MDTYWMLEYGKVFGGYIFLMFIWPNTVFGKYLNGKSKLFRFNFCVTVQIVIVNTTVLMLGLFHILNQRVVIWMFYGMFFSAIWRKEKSIKIRAILFGDRKQCVQQLIILKTEIAKEIRTFWQSVRLRIGEYIILFIVVIFGTIYFSYGVFQVHSYVHYDTFTHHGWINSLVEGTVFSKGIYPEAMHCFVYCLHTLFGIRVYSALLFLQCIHIATFLIAAYGLLRAIFQWRYSPVFVLALYLTMDVSFEYSISRLQATLPMEFGLYTQFLCARYLIQYLKNDKYIVRKGRKIKGIWDENLLLLSMSLAASIAIHYYTTIMAFIICASIAMFQIKKIFSPKHFLPLIVAVFCGCMIAIIPMAGGFISGIPFEGSIEWGINSIEGNNNRNSQEGQQTNSDVLVTARGLLEPTSEDLEVIEKLPGTGQKIIKGIIKVEYLIKETYRKGYQEMYWGRGNRIFGITLLVIGLCFIGRKWGDRRIIKIINRYPPIVLASVLVVLIYAAYNSPDMGIPILIADHRFCSSGHMLVLAVMVMPSDAIFSMMVYFVKDSILQRISYISALGIYIFTNLFGIYHNYLYSVLLRYDAAALVTNAIIEEFPQDSYTIVSPIDEKHQITPYGSYEEIIDFLNKCEEENYFLPTEYVFLYVEKRPIVYFQSYYFSGPAWLGRSKEIPIETLEISEEYARKEMLKSSRWSQYEKEGRPILESKMYEWCKDFEKHCSGELNIFYEDDNFVCYYFKQDVATPYNLGI